MTDDENRCDHDGHIVAFLAEWHAVDKAAGIPREACADTLAADPPQPDLAETARRLRAGPAQDRWQTTLGGIPHVQVIADHQPGARRAVVDEGRQPSGTPPSSTASSRRPSGV